MIIIKTLLVNLIAGLMAMTTNMFIDNPPATAPDELFCLQMNAWIIDEGGLQTCFLRVCEHLPNCDDGGNGTKIVAPNVSAATSTSAQIALSLQPNPAESMVSVSYQLLAEQGVLTLTDAKGKTLITQNIIKQTDAYQLSVSKLSTGIYFIKLKDAGGSQLIKKLAIIK